MWSGKSTSAPAYPSTKSSVNINPAAVPVRDAVGGEALFYKGDWDFSIVKGTGRVGAAISPSNSEETFFGPPGYERFFEYVQRKSQKEKYVSSKITLATGVQVLTNKRKDLKRFELNLGVLLKYNKDTRLVRPGGGFSGVLGPFTFGFSVYKDDFLMVYEPYLNRANEVQSFQVNTYSIGIFLNSLAVDYSLLYSHASDPFAVSILTGSLFLQRWILTVSNRAEASSRPKYNFAKKLWELSEIKRDWFFGSQFAVTKTLLVGGFFNYYLLSELSVGLTLFI